MKFLGFFLALSIGYTSICYATQMIPAKQAVSTKQEVPKKQEGYALQYVKPIIVKIFSNMDGVTKEENFSCTPKTCCFSERFYCFMENGKCICDLHRCSARSDKKSYWMELSGTEAERYCGRPRLLHRLTNLCFCDRYKDSPCDECNPPPNSFVYGEECCSCGF